MRPAALHVVLLSLATAALAGCGSSDSGGSGDGGAGLSVTTDPSIVLVRQGATQLIKVTLAGPPSGGATAIALSDLPDGVSADSLTLPAGTDHGALMVSAGQSAAQGAFDATLTATASESGRSAETTLRVLVAGPPGTLDQSFASAGLFQTQATAAAATYGRGLALDGDGRPLVAGYLSAGGGYQGILYRLAIDGTPDESFGDQGLVTIASGDLDSAGVAVLMPSPGHVIMGGLVGDYGTDTGLALFAFDDTGQPDSTFGDMGTATFQPGAELDVVRSLLAGADGALVAVGPDLRSCTNPVPGTYHKVRFTSAGAIDSSWASRTDSGCPQAALLDSKGRLVVVGTENQDMFVLRYLDDGSADPAFGTGGAVAIDLGGSDLAAGVTELSDGHLLVAAIRDHLTGAAHLETVRLQSDGSPDADHGTGGIVDSGLALDSEAEGALAVDSQGRLVVVGFTGPANLAVARLLPDGTPDDAFGAGGLFTLEATDATAAADGLYGIAFDPDGRIIVSGTVGPQGGQALVVGRLWP